MTLIELTETNRGDVPAGVTHLVAVDVPRRGDAYPEFYRDAVEGNRWNIMPWRGRPSDGSYDDGTDDTFFARPATRLEVAANEANCSEIPEDEREVIEIREGDWHGTWADGVTTCGKCSPPESAKTPAGYDRVAPPHCSAECEWSSKVHGDHCPQLGCKGQPLPSQAQRVDFWAVTVSMNGETLLTIDNDLSGKSNLSPTEMKDCFGENSTQS